MSGSGIHISLGGLSGLGVALLGLALTSEHFGGDPLLSVFCLFAGIFCIIAVIITRIDSYYLNREAFKKQNNLR